jgi:hypothetical protein
VNTLWKQGGNAKSIAERLRVDVSLSEPQRRAALNLLLGRSARLHSQLQENLNALYARQIFTANVVEALEADDTLDPAMRHHAVARARARGDAPNRLDDDSRKRVRYAGGDPEAYALGLRAIEKAVRAEPDNGHFLNTLGVAQYRNRRYVQTVETLRRADVLNQQETAGGYPHDVAVLAMALHRLKQTDEARVMFERLKGLMSDPNWRGDEEAITLFEEAKQMFEESDPQTGLD